MTTEAQIAANRRNAQKSTGPRTAEGKAVVAQNAVTHGLMARAAVLPGKEREEYARFREQMLEELHPEGVQERAVAERIADLSWRLRRAGQYQNAVFEALYEEYAADLAESGDGPDGDGSVSGAPVLGRMLLTDFSGERVLERALLYERRTENSLHRARAELRQLRQERGSAGQGQSCEGDSVSRVAKAAAVAEPVRSVPVRAHPEGLERTNPMSLRAAAGRDGEEKTAAVPARV